MTHNIHTPPIIPQSTFPLPIQRSALSNLPNPTPSVSTTSVPTHLNTRPPLPTNQPNAKPPVPTPLLTNHQVIIDALVAQHKLDLDSVKQAARDEIRLVLSEVTLAHQARVDTLVLNMQTIVDTHTRNNVATSRILDRLESLYERTDEDRRLEHARQIGDRIDEIKTTQDAVTGAIQALGAQVLSAVTDPTTDKDRFNTSGSALISRDDALTLSLPQLNDLFTKLSKNEYMYKKRQDERPNPDRANSILIIQQNKALIKEVRQLKKSPIL